MYPFSPHIPFHPGCHIHYFLKMCLASFFPFLLPYPRDPYYQNRAHTKPLVSLYTSLPSLKSFPHTYPPLIPTAATQSLKGLLISNCIRSKLLCLFSRPFSIYPNLLIRLNVPVFYICFPFTAHKHVLLISAHGSDSSQCSQNML